MPHNLKNGKPCVRPDEHEGKCWTQQWLDAITEGNRRRAKDPVWREQNRAQLQQLHNDPVVQAKIVKATRDNPEWLRKNTEASRKRFSDPVWKEKHTESVRRGIAQSPTWKEQQLNHVRARTNNPAWSAVMSKAIQKKYEDPEYRSKILAAAKRRAEDPEWRRNHDEAVRRLAQDPSWQSSVSAAMMWRDASDEERAFYVEMGLMTPEGRFVEGADFEALERQGWEMMKEELGE